MFKNKDPRIKQIRESFLSFESAITIKFYVIKNPYGKCALKALFFVAKII